MPKSNGVAQGRATFQRKKVLNANGFSNAALLTLARDFDAVRVFVDFQQKIREKLADGKTLVQCLTEKRKRL